MAPLPTRDAPTTERMNSRFTVSLAAGTSDHFASSISRRPPGSATKSTSRVRPREEFITTIVVKMRKNLAVTVFAEAMTTRFELLPQFHVVVDFSMQITATVRPSLLRG